MRDTCDHQAIFSCGCLASSMPMALHQISPFKQFSALISTVICAAGVFSSRNRIQHANFKDSGHYPLS